MMTLLTFIAREKIDGEKIISHEFELLEAKKAMILFFQILNRSGILVRYDFEQTKRTVVRLQEVTVKQGLPNVGFIGAGNFAQNMLLPRMKNYAISISIATAKGMNRGTSPINIILINVMTPVMMWSMTPGLDTIFIVTRHDLHAKLVLKDIKQEKCIVENHWQWLRLIWKPSGQPMISPEMQLWFGFHRRFLTGIQKQWVFSKLPAQFQTV